jgi:hypothetical protein
LRSWAFLAGTAASIAFPAAAYAYVGPGAGISVLGALWGLVVGVLTAIGIILFWPIRMMIRKSKAKKAGEETVAADGTTTADAVDEPAESESTPS